MASELTLEPDKALEYKQGKAERAISFGYKSLLREAATYYALDDPDAKRRLARQSAKYALKVAPNAPREELKSIARSRMESVGSKQRLSQLGREKAVQKALSEGGYKLPDDVLPTEKQRKSIARDEPWKLNRLQAMARLLDETEDPAERMRIFAGEATPEEKARMVQLRAEEQRGPPDKSGWLMGSIEKLGAAGTGLRSGIASAVGDLQKLGPPPKAAEDEGGIKGAARELLGGHIPGTPDWLQYPVASVFPSVAIAGKLALGDHHAGGVDVPAALSKAWDEGQLDDIATDALKAVWAGAKSPRAVPLSRPLQEAAKQYRKAAAQKAIDEMGADAPREELRARARELFEETVDRDVLDWAVRSPILAEVAFDIALDPLTYVAPLAAAIKVGKLIPGSAAAVRGAKAGVASVARGTAKGIEAIEKTPVGGEVVGRARDVGQALGEYAGTAKGVLEKFQYMPMMRRFQKKGNAAAEAASLARAAEAKAIIAGANTQEKSARLLQRMKKVKDAEGKARLDAYMRLDPDEAARQMAVAGETDAMVDAVAAGRELGDVLWEHMGAAKLDRRWGKLATTTDGATAVAGKKAAGPDILVGTPKRANYIPHLLDESGEVRQFTGGSDLPVRGRLRAKGAHVRKGETTPLKDPAAQFGAKLRDELPKAIKARQLVETHHAMAAKGFSITVPRESAEAALSQARAMSPENEWTTLLDGDEGIQEVYDRLTGGLMQQKGVSATIVPTEYKELIDSMMPVIHNGDPAFLSDVHNKAVRVFSIPSKHFRYFTTVPNYGYSFKNMLGAIGLSTITHGLEAFNPAFQSKAMLASFLGASGNPRAAKFLGKLSWTMRNGEKVPMQKVLDAAREVGLMHQLDHRLAMEVFIKRGKVVDLPVRVGEYVADGKFLEQLGGKVGGTAGELIGAAAMLSPGAMAKATENYQHFVTFLGALDNLSPQGVAKALDITSDATGNYMRMGDWERGILRHMLGFYAWNRFILPRMTKELWQNPGRLSAWAKSMGGLERWFGADAPFSKEGVPNHLRAWGVSAPRYAQLQQRIPGINTHEYSMMQIENPLAMGFSLWPAVAGLLQLNPETDYQRAAELMGPMAHMSLELWTGQDLKTGAPIEPFFDFSSPAGAATSVVGELGKQMYGRPISAMADMYNLYANKSLAYDKLAEHVLRMKVGRDFLGLDNIAARMVGAEPRSIGGPLDIPALGGSGVGVGFQYPVNPVVQHSYRHRKSTGMQVPQTRRKYERLSPAFAPSEDDE